MFCKFPWFLQDSLLLLFALAETMYIQGRGNSTCDSFACLLQCDIARGGLEDDSVPALTDEPFEVSCSYLAFNPDFEFRTNSSRGGLDSLLRCKEAQGGSFLIGRRHTQLDGI